MTFTAIGDWQWIDFESTASTNDEAKKLISENNKLIVTSKEQTAGRGRMGHKWIGLEGNLLMSLGLNWNADNTNVLAFISSLAIYKTIKKFSRNINIMLKWPNDVLINKQKISGILIELVPPSKVIIGIGVNICASPKLDENTPYLPTSLKEHGINIDRLDFMRAYIEVFEEITTTYQKDGSQKIIDMWLSHAHKIGQKIIVKTEKTEIFGEFIGLDKQGLMLLKTPDNNIKTISAGDIFF